MKHVKNPIILASFTRCRSVKFEKKVDYTSVEDDCPICQNREQNNQICGICQGSGYVICMF